MRQYGFSVLLLVIAGCSSNADGGDDSAGNDLTTGPLAKTSVTTVDAYSVKLGQGLDATHDGMILETPLDEGCLTAPVQRTDGKPKQWGPSAKVMRSADDLERAIELVNPFPTKLDRFAADNTGGKRVTSLS